MIQDRDPGMLADELLVQRKRLKVRSQQRGLREVDLLLTAFAQRYLPDLSSEQLEMYEQLLTLDDQTLYSWINQQCAVHPSCDHQVMDMLIELANRHGAAYLSGYQPGYQPIRSQS